MTIATSLDLGKMDCFGLSDIGRARGINADQFLVADLKISLSVHGANLGSSGRIEGPATTQAQLLVVCDGIGGKSGQRASHIAVETIVRRILTSPDLIVAAQGYPEHGNPLPVLAELLRDCREQMLADGNGKAARYELGTTVTLAFIVWPWLYLAHAGDSRCYLFRNRRIRQLTTDHTYAQRMLESGILSADQVIGSRWNNVLWNVVGNGAAELRPETRAEYLRTGDSLLLCTDGLFRTIPEFAIRKILAEKRTAQENCELLINAARRGGTADNATAVVARFHRWQDFPRNPDGDLTETGLRDCGNTTPDSRHGNGGPARRKTHANGHTLDDTHVT